MRSRQRAHDLDGAREQKQLESALSPRITARDAMPARQYLIDRTTGRREVHRKNFDAGRPADYVMIAVSDRHGMPPGSGARLRQFFTPAVGRAPARLSRV